MSSFRTFNIGHGGRTGWCAHAGNGHSARGHLDCADNGGTINNRDTGVQSACGCECHDQPRLTEAEISQIDADVYARRREAMERNMEFQAAGGWKGVATALQEKIDAALTELQFVTCFDFQKKCDALRRALTGETE